MPATYRMAKLERMCEELANALYWLLNLHHGVSRGGPRYTVIGREWEEALDRGQRVHARYQEEVGDGETLP